ncbi:MAG: TetR/AcrR family transcriptional regulator [Anaerolineae bacterium]
MPDRRPLRTRQLLRDALTSLILERGYDSITIQDITDKANLGRATFYLHYKDKEELLSKSLEEVFDDLKARIGEPSVEDFLTGGSRAGLIIFEHVAANSDLYRVMLQAQGAAGLQKGVRDYLALNVEQRFRSVLLKGIDIPYAMLGHFCAGTVITLATWWLENDMPHTPEEMARMYNRLIVTGIVGFLAEKGVIPAPEK